MQLLSQRSLSLRARFAVLGGGALRGGMPCGNTFQTASSRSQRIFLIGAKLSEYHTGYRAFSRQLLERLSIANEPNDIVFDNQILAQIIALDCAIGEVTARLVTCPKRLRINFRRSVRYGLGCLATAVRFRLARWGLVPDRLKCSRKGDLQIAHGGWKAADLIARSISASHDVMAMDPDSLPVPRCPMSCFRCNKCGLHNSLRRGGSKADRPPPQ